MRVVSSKLPSPKTLGTGSEGQPEKESVISFVLNPGLAPIPGLMCEGVGSPCEGKRAEMNNLGIPSQREKELQEDPKPGNSRPVWPVWELLAT